MPSAGLYAASSGNLLPTFRDLSVQRFLSMGLTCDNPLELVFDYMFVCVCVWGGGEAKKFKFLQPDC
jgi:hypothetical protein